MDAERNPIDQSDRAAVIQKLVENLKAHYIFPDIAERMSARIQKCFEDGEYGQINDGELFAKTLTDQMHAVYPDKHLGIHWHPEALPDFDGPLHENKALVEEWRQMVSLDNYGLYKVERLAGNVGYLDIRSFASPAWGGDTAAAAMNFLANTSALIVDLRKNGGGHPGMVSFITSYLFGEEPVHLNTMFWDSHNEAVHQQFWTLPFVPGKRFGDKPVFVLTSKDTFSGGEEFAYNLKSLKRATLIGETTGGGAHPGSVYRLHANFEVFIPTGRPVNPVTGADWEGVGVSPDIPAEAEQAFALAYRMALDAIIAQIDEAAPPPFQRLKDEAQTALKTLEPQKSSS